MSDRGYQNPATSLSANTDLAVLTQRLGQQRRVRTAAGNQHIPVALIAAP